MGNVLDMKLPRRLSLKRLRRNFRKDAISRKTYTFDSVFGPETNQAKFSIMWLSLFYMTLKHGTIVLLSSNQKARGFPVKISYVELYNENLEDLLSDDSRKLRMLVDDGAFVGHEEGMLLVGYKFLDKVSLNNILGKQIVIEAQLDNEIMTAEEDLLEVV
ncbi:hypothetical protein RCL_jg835.t1 [Rhizophagus clarus]|uniref:Kinesin motor domain-containing protein n=1 Tax=Rhizophagus clarus TaxID=94130 RepID=A0A8H3MFG8_9GLOM|nr:hypothetical protein RCL_jg835.t1 [Rhizophagus clarus]